jgi:hypothetical protein
MKEKERQLGQDSDFSFTHTAKITSDDLCQWIHSRPVTNPQHANLGTHSGQPTHYLWDQLFSNHFSCSMCCCFHCDFVTTLGYACDSTVIAREILSDFDLQSTQGIGYFPDNLLHGVGSSYKWIGQFKEGLLHLNLVSELTTLFVEKMLGVPWHHPKYRDPRYLLEKSYKMTFSSSSVKIVDPQLALNKALLNVPSDEKAVIQKCFDLMRKQLISANANPLPGTAVCNTFLSADPATKFDDSPNLSARINGSACLDATIQSEFLNPLALPYNPILCNALSDPLSEIQGPSDKVPPSVWSLVDGVQPLYSLLEEAKEVFPPKFKLKSSFTGDYSNKGSTKQLQLAFIAIREIVHLGLTKGEHIDGEQPSIQSCWKAARPLFSRQAHVALMQHINQFYKYLSKHCNFSIESFSEAIPDYHSKWHLFQAMHGKQQASEPIMCAQCLLDAQELLRVKAT